MSKERDAVFKAISDERDYQDKLWGGAHHDDTHDERDWCSYIVTYLGKAVDWDNSKNGTQDPMIAYEKNMIIVAALAVAALEQLERKKP